MARRVWKQLGWRRRLKIRFQTWNWTKPWYRLYWSHWCRHDDCGCRRGRLRAKPLAFCADHLLSELRARGYDR